MKRVNFNEKTFNEKTFNEKTFNEEIIKYHTIQETIALIKSALTNVPVPISEIADIDLIFNIAKKHKIAYILYLGLGKCKAKFSSEMQKCFRGEVVQAYQQCEEQAYEGRILQEALSKANIDHLPLKGMVVREYYPIPEMRTMGDLDILIRDKEYAQAKRVLLELGFEEEEYNQCNHVYVFHKGIINLEIHELLVPPDEKDYFTYYQDGWKFAEETNIPHRYKFSDEECYIYLFVHFAKHMRKTGVGIKHVLDLYLYREAFPDLDMDYVKCQLSQLKLWEFHKITLSMLEVWFANEEETELTVKLTQNIFNNGVFGKQSIRLASNVIIQNTKVGNLHISRLQKKLEIIFLCRGGMESLFPILKKRPYLLPVYWVIRWIQILTQRRENITLRLSATPMDEIRERQKFLEEMCLGFYFK